MRALGRRVPAGLRAAGRRAWALLGRRRTRLVASIVAVALAGGVAGMLLAGATGHRVGPVDARFSVRPALSGGTEISVPPLGSLRLDSHRGPLELDVRAVQLRVAEAQAIFRNPSRIETLPQRVTGDVRHAMLGLVLRTVAVTVLGAVLLALVVFRRWRPVVAAGGVALVVVAASGGVAALTFSPQALAEPHYSGLLANAPAAVGDARDIVERFDRYSRQLASLVTNVSRLYDVTSTLPQYQPDAQTIRLLHVSDVHDNPVAFSIMKSIVDEFHIDLIADTGDLTDHGSGAESGLVRQVADLGVPYVYIRGNHDSAATERAVARQPNAVVLDGDSQDVAELRLFGVGDPRFTPDKTTRDDDLGAKAMLRFGQQAADRLLTSEPPPADVVLVHDPVMAPPFAGAVPLVLAGHLHHRDDHDLGDGTLLLVEGSTGGAGLRGLEGEEPTPFEASVLYFDRNTHRLQAYDDVTVGGLGTSSVKIDRHVVAPGKAGSGTVPTPTPTPAGASGLAGSLVPGRDVAYASLVPDGRRRGWWIR